jgi:TetR/AcrR family transcriptional repressor of uid operon
MPGQAARVLELALAPHPEGEPDVTAERILDAALELAAASGLRHLTMDQVAVRAGVGRMTVYRRFSSRAELVDALTVRESRRCLERLQADVEAETDTADRLTALFVTTLVVIREHPMLARLARFEPEALITELTRDDSAAFRLVRTFLVGLIREGQASGELVEGDPDLLAELALRLGASFVLIPDSVLPLHDEVGTWRRVRGLIGSTLTAR